MSERITAEQIAAALAQHLDGAAARMLLITRRDEIRGRLLDLGKLGPARELTIHASTTVALDDERRLLGAEFAMLDRFEELIGNLAEIVQASQR